MKREELQYHLLMEFWEYALQKTGEMEKQKQEGSEVQQEFRAR